MQPKAEVGRAEQRKTHSESLDLHYTYYAHGSAAKKRHQGIRKTSDLGGGTRMINAVERQEYDMVK